MRALALLVAMSLLRSNGALPLDFDRGREPAHKASGKAAARLSISTLCLFASPSSSLCAMAVRPF